MEWVKILGIYLVVTTIFYHLAYLYYKDTGRLKSDLRNGGVNIIDVTRLIIEDLKKLYKRIRDKGE